MALDFENIDALIISTSIDLSSLSLSVYIYIYGEN